MNKTRTKMNKTRIEWADGVWNPMTGCTPIGAGCTHCYAARMATPASRRLLSLEPLLGPVTLVNAAERRTGLSAAGMHTWEKQNFLRARKYDSDSGG